VLLDLVALARTTPPARQRQRSGNTSTGVEFDFVVLIKSFCSGGCKPGALVIALGNF
jgi:hypothetical protein